MTTIRASSSLVALVIVACGGSSSPSSTPAFVGNRASVSVEARTPDGRYFVIEPTSLCPNHVEAVLRTCGNSIEDPADGYLLPLGTNITIGGEDSGAIWNSPRYMMSGVLPGFVDSTALARRPKLEHLVAYRVAHPDAKVYSPKDIALGTDADGQLDYTLVFDGVAHKFGEMFDQDDVWSERHSCLIDSCAELNYLCDDTYCDEIVIELGVNGDVATIVDRYGVFTAR